MFHVFWVLSTRKNRVIYNVFVPLASKKSLWQHAGNCVNTSVFARPGPQNTVNTVVVASRGSKPRKYRGFALTRSQKHRYLRCFFVPRTWKIAKTPPIWRFLGVCKNRRFDDFGVCKKVPTTKITTTTTTGPSSNSYITTTTTTTTPPTTTKTTTTTTTARCSSQHVMSASSDEIPLSLSLPPTPTGIAGVRSSTISCI